MVERENVRRLKPNPICNRLTVKSTLTITIFGENCRLSEKLGLRCI